MDRAKGKPRWRTWGLLALVVLAIVGAKAWQDTMRDPVVRRITVTLADYPAGAPPVRVALISDIHPAKPDMPLERVHRIVGQINALHPDVVVVAGDMVSDRPASTQLYSIRDSLAPLGELRAPLGVFAVQGNHDKWSDFPAVTRELKRNNVRLLRGQAVRAGPLAIGGLDEAQRGFDQIDPTLAKMDRLGGAKVLVHHNPFIFEQVPNRSALILAGHTHCGQIQFPWGGTPAWDNSGKLDEYLCGVKRDGGKTMIITAGLGNSLIPVRFFAPPDIWLVEIRGRDAQTKTAAGSLRRP